MELSDFVHSLLKRYLSNIDFTLSRFEITENFSKSVDDKCGFDNKLTRLTREPLI